MAKKESILSPEIFINAAIEKETCRVISEHLPTIYSVKVTIQDGKNELELFSPREVERHIRHFFAVSDKVIESCARGLNVKKNTLQTFQLFFRRLYTVTTIESQISAVEQGIELARQMAGGEESGILHRHSGGESGRLFTRTARLTSPTDLSQQKSPKVILFTDDAAHSGEQMRINTIITKDFFPKVPIIISVGAISDRAQATIRRGLSSKDCLIFQEVKPCLKTMIDELPVEEMRQEMMAFANCFFANHMKNANSMESGLLSTHIVTPFKLPDLTSNGRLGSIRSLFSKKEVYFTMRSADSMRDRCYPQVL